MKGWKSILKKGLLLIGILFLLAVLCVGGLVEPLLMVPLYLIFGWIPFITTNAQELEIKPLEVLGFIAFAGLLFYGLHRFMVRFLLERHESLRDRWKGKNSFQLLGAFFLLFFTSIAFTGAIHQLKWMSDEELISSNGLRRRAMDFAHTRYQLTTIAETFKKKREEAPKISWEEVRVELMEKEKEWGPILVDIWENPIEVRVTGNNLFLRSFGADGELGGEDEEAQDIVLLLIKGEMILSEPY